ncbi:tRNA(Met) cytidine acetyltransferase TmcA [Candidatus Symbiopectobacterium sp. NZEC135]|uniref:tRNA(Met) cytidine acetyltransferase TmcA n=1 Tax=Candidatus Symbiopectobacterium sp. NZEC135 TaxID=2820471 RepID=UPI0022272071|nr:GNAT family N-acetyltransferase [Candidatus Symbiopectobacterium sp. NZEC135]MCW2478330.1 tRNA(Met) cytidine acetyltransferase [Candidatus Symbiopectobacterium sp. NZEC135]
MSELITPNLLSADANGDPELLRHVGARRLLVVSGEMHWVQRQAEALCRQTPGDWLWLGGTQPDSIPFSKARRLLGQEYQHAVFDARIGLDVEALAIVAGTLRAGSWLLLLVPPWRAWAQQPDVDSLRWSEQSQAIATPNFITHFQQQLLADHEITLWRQGEAGAITPLAPRAPWRPANGDPTPQQQALLTRLQEAAAGVYVITAARGRGKSTLAGMLAAQCTGVCWVTSPSRDTAAQLLQCGGAEMPFWSPDALLAYCQSSTVPPLDWLLIDEAAAIPASVLQALVSYFPRVLMLTTVQGYEGTGRGFLLKFCASLPQCDILTLDQPLRWAANDPLERFLDEALLFRDTFTDVDTLNSRSTRLPAVVTKCLATAWLSEPAALHRYYALLCSAHYRTSPLDLRRLLDAPGMHLYGAQRGEALCGVAWWVDEGNLSPALAHEVWAGRRRPRGNLVAQSLAAHGDEWQAPCLRSRRISRIAVVAEQRRCGIGHALIAAQRDTASDDGIDFLSVSFGYQPELWAFWQACGFRLVRIGSHREASSGCYSAMAILPISEEGRQLATRAERCLAQAWPALCRIIPLALPLQLPVFALSTLEDTEWRSLAGFAFAHRGMEPTFAALTHLMAQSGLPLPALRLLHAYPQEPERGVTQFSLSGKKALLQRWREETAQVLAERDAEACARWQRWVQPGGFRLNK